jgi:hypothetical protein
VQHLMVQELGVEGGRRGGHEVRQRLLHEVGVEDGEELAVGEGCGGSVMAGKTVQEVRPLSGVVSKYLSASIDIQVYTLGFVVVHAVLASEGLDEVLERHIPCHIVGAADGGLHLEQHGSEGGVERLEVEGQLGHHGAELGLCEVWQERCGVKW